jgi:cell wall-associated NlpC family hydrolase
MASFRLTRPAASLRLTSVAVAIAALVSTTVVGLTASPAGADSLEEQIASAQARLHELDEKAEAAAERYNAARIQLQGDQQKAEQAKSALARAERHLAVQEKAVAAFAKAAYQGQGIDTTFSITAESPQEFLDKTTTLQALADSQTRMLADLAAARLQHGQAQATATAALQAQETATEQMEADRQEVLDAADEQQEILSDLQERQRQIIAAAKARAERIAAERAAAALAARQAAAAAAAQALSAQPVSSPPVHGSGGASVAVQWAYKQLGKPYVWGAAGPDSFDCSGLTQYVWGKAGVYLSHYTGAQWNEGAHVDRSQLQPGDLVFFGSDLHHMGIYIGGSKMIEAPHTGANVRIAYAFRSDYAGAVRPGV